jgi:hypothetical protein
MILLLSCGLIEQRADVAVNSKTSACGGFKSLSKQVAESYSQDTLAYCSAERLIWNYLSNEKQLSLMHARISANCAAKLEVRVEKTDNAYVLIEKDTRNPNVSADCDCVFDTYCEIPNVQGIYVDLVFENKNYQLDLSKSCDTIIIDTISLYQCGMPQ